MKRKGQEAAASASIEHLEKQVSHLRVVTLDKNSSFYWQDDEAADLPLSEFKSVYFHELIKENGPYYWSSHLDPAEWKGELQQILDETGTRYFSAESSLNQQERQDFIELSYIAILNHLVKKWEPPSINITCKHALDRGPLSVLWMLEQGIGTSKEVAALLLAPPLLVHNRPSHRYRIARLVSAAERMAKLDASFRP